jgi:eukaryotic-like serine/threonine-protein kinase
MNVTESNVTESTAAEGDIDVGQLIAGKYELVRLLGKGAMGEVWAATHNSLGGEFAIKLVRPSDDIEDETASGRFQLEAQVSAKLSRKTRHIISVSDHGEENGLAYLVMELLEGESLETRVKRVGKLELPETVAILRQVARALAIAHAEGIFHRDLKPANVFLTHDPENSGLLVKLLDFGIARSAKPFRTRSPFQTSKDMVLGTPSYMSPEQARGLDTLDYRCDLWALAVVAYEALTKKIPWEGETVEDIFLSICTHRVIPVLSQRADLPPEVEPIFTRAFAPRLEDRYASADELSAAFEELVDPAEVDALTGITATPTSIRRMPSSQSIQVAPPREEPVSELLAVSLTDDIEEPPKRRTGWIGAAVAGLGTLIIIALALLIFRSKAAMHPPPGEPVTQATAPTVATPPVSPPLPTPLPESERVSDKAMNPEPTTVPSITRPSRASSKSSPLVPSGRAPGTTAKSGTPPSVFTPPAQAAPPKPVDKGEIL